MIVTVLEEGNDQLIPSDLFVALLMRTSSSFSGEFVLSLRCLATCGGILNPCQSHKPMSMKEA